jgi:hypothetical protein
VAGRVLQTQALFEYTTTRPYVAEPTNSYSFWIGKVGSVEPYIATGNGGANCQTGVNCA